VTLKTPTVIILFIAVSNLIKTPASFNRI